MRFSMNQSRQIILPTHLTRYKRETDKAGGEARIRHQTKSICSHFKHDGVE